MTEQDNTNNNAGQQDSAPVVQAGHPSPASTDEEHPPASEADTDRDDTDDTDDGNADGKGNREAAKLRKRAQKAEAERDEARTQRDAAQDMLTKTRQSIVDTAVHAAGVDPRLIAAAGHTVETLVGEDGLIDHDKLSAAIAETAREFRVPPKSRPPQPNRQQGTGSGQPHGQSSWSSALKAGRD
ncbi:hypothetical protein MMAG44476_23132 [Mycolicibacterium mageritense DSM 44476 = CIP 104973]|uniref:DUF4355 domain-containing protein n=1 Tax=Mycolicibacterium mageritense TaxID=53462 RepID=A0ABM7HTN1_MYCME|nr:hypothetical protein [Mycolicibacterium mageritense]MCC9186737.1 hypothetical protein [Mycolicibacterium mageritense]BBX33934.1 hypothetical protein MMAGJ_32160 [Mycolicibacterium mageritense]CDO22354.1 hypothetical protein BN978_02827 [Mycolicibacterium mageritense DSM 44476 = CIP 104973]